MRHVINLWSADMLILQVPARVIIVINKIYHDMGWTLAFIKGTVLSHFPLSNHHRFYFNDHDSPYYIQV